MDSGERDDDSKSSSEESDHQQVNGRSYECVFCKRGFTTAQALGGHMNIHRKDRARIIQPIVPSVSNKPGEDLEYVNSPSPSISSYPPHYSASLEAQTNYHMYFPASSSSSTRHPHAYHTNNSNIRNPRHSSLVVEDWRTNLSLRIGPTRMEDSEEEKIEDGKEDELDLELRLGNGR